MATATKTPRLLAAAKEFNIGKETLVEYLTGKGFEINASNPNTKLTEVMYDALQAEFAGDKLAKRKSEEIALPKGSMLDNINKTKEDLDITKRDHKEDLPLVVEEKKTKEKPVEEPKPAPVPPPPPPPPPVEEVPIPVVEEKPKEEPIPAIEEPVAEEKPVKKAVKKDEKVEEKETATPALETPPQENIEDTHIAIAAPKLGGPIFWVR